MARKKKSRFLNAWERKLVLEAALEESGMSYYALSKESGVALNNLHAKFRNVFVRDDGEIRTYNGTGQDVPAGNPSFLTVRKIARALGVTMGYFCDRKET